MFFRFFRAARHLSAEAGLKRTRFCGGGPPHPPTAPPPKRPFLKMSFTIQNAYILWPLTHTRNSDKGCGSANREAATRTGTGSATSLLSPKASATAAAIGNSNISASTAVASRDPRARRGSLPIFDRISTACATPSSTTSKEEMGRDGRVKETDDNTLSGSRSGNGSGNGNGNSSTTAGVASGIGAGVTANADFERRGPPRRRHSASATQIEAISRQAFGGGDAAAYESDSSSDSSAWLDSDSDSDDED